MTRSRGGAIGRRTASTAIATALLLPAWARAQSLKLPPSITAPQPPAPAPEAPPAPVLMPVREARRLGIGAVALVKSAEGVDLDFTPPSLEKIDAIVLKMRDEGASTDGVTGQVLLVLGCYVGEVLVRNTGGLWVEAGPEEQRAGISVPVVRMRDGVVFNPINRVVSLLENGSTDSVAFYYAAVKREDAK